PRARPLDPPIGSVRVFGVVCACEYCLLFFFFNDTATTEIYTLSLHDALPISLDGLCRGDTCRFVLYVAGICRSEEHTSELQSLTNLVCRLLLEKKKHQKDRRKDNTWPGTDFDCAMQRGPQ